MKICWYWSRIVWLIRKCNRSPVFRHCVYGTECFEK